MFSLIKLKKTVLRSHNKENMKLKNDMKKKKKIGVPISCAKRYTKKKNIFSFRSTKGKIPQVY